jgi:NAD(P)-dependent dehydrogenase (short-subunit alcohol dehydrogenase family)
MGTAAARRTEKEMVTVPKPIAEQVVVVVGASSGIGRASALEFAGQGAKVVAASRNAEALEGLVGEILADGGEAVAVPTDVAVPEQVYALADQAEEHYGRIDTWVNDAAVAVWGRIEDISDAEFERVMRVNFLGQVYGVHAAVPALRRAGGGVIIGVSSMEGIRAVPLHAPYTASKWALRGFYDSLRIELAESKDAIAVSTVLPAAIDTPFFEHARSRVDTMPKPPPPTYAPEVVAEAIVRAAVRPTREVPVGGAVAAALVSQRLAPALTDALMSLTRTGFASQKAPRRDNMVDNVDSPVREHGSVHGTYAGTVLRSSAFTALLGHRKRPGELVGDLVQQVRRRAS